MSGEMVKPVLPEEIERVVMGGDLSGLSVPQKLAYYKAVCESVGLNPLTKPFDLIRFQGKEILYANKNCGEQLRNIHGISVYKLERDRSDDAYAVTAYGRNAKGREDTALGVVPIKGLAGEALANAMMKGETKAKRRLTLSMAGLGMLDETEVETIPGATKVALEMPQISPVAPQEARSEPPPAPAIPISAPTETNPLIPPVKAENVKAFLDDIRSRAGRCTDFVQLAAWFNQNTGIARKYDCWQEFLEIKYENYQRLSEADESDPLIDPPAETPEDYMTEFYAADAVARKNGDLKTIWLELRPNLKEAGLEKQWNEYIKKLKAEVEKLKQEASS